MSIEQLKAAKERFLKKYPYAAVGIGSRHSLAVSVASEKQAADLPRKFEGFEVRVRVVGKIKPQ